MLVATKTLLGLPDHLLPLKPAPVIHPEQPQDGSWAMSLMHIARFESQVELGGMTGLGLVEGVAIEWGSLLHGLAFTHQAGPAGPVPAER